MLEAKNVGGVDAHIECEECQACQKLHPKTSAACPGQTGVFSNFLCEKIREGIKKVAAEKANLNIGKPFENLMDAHSGCDECDTCRDIHPKTSKACPGQTGEFSYFTCEALRKSIKHAENHMH